jgi:signal transduction histidine kinase
MSNNDNPDTNPPQKDKKSLHKNNQGLETLLEVSKSLVGTLDMQHILQTAVAGVTKLVELDTAAVYTLENAILHLWATTPPLPPQFPYELHDAPLAAHPHIGKAISAGKPLLVPDLMKEDLTPQERVVAEQRNLRTVLYLPLVADGHAMGAFIVGSIHKPSSVSDGAINLSSTLANLAALAVKNAQLFQDGQNYAAQLEHALADRIRAEEEREKLKTQLLQAQKLESIGRLAGGVAHDFNNMLSVILGRADLALRKVDPADSLHRDITQIRQAAQRSADLTRQLLAFARRQTIEPKILNLNEVINDMLNMLCRLIGEDIDLSWMPTENLGLVKMDPAQVDQILANLCVNARDAITGAGKILIETSNTAFDETYCNEHPGFLPGEYIMLAVSDNGTGISDETLPNIFEPFFSTKKAGEGTGLGLSTVYGIVKQNKGFINVYSEPGQGTIFKIYLSRHNPTEKAKRSKTITYMPQGGSETILLVEDEPMVLNLARQMLESLGYQVLAVNAPSDALQVAEHYKGTIDLLVTDVVMPEMNGPQLAKQLTVIFPSLKTLYMSGYTANVIVHHGVVSEGVKLLQKPFSKEELAAKVHDSIRT